MSNNYYLHFKNAKTKTDTEFFEGVASWLIKKGLRYLSFWVEGDEIPISFNDAIRKLPEGGRISFKVGDNDLSIDCSNELSLVTHPVNFGESKFFIDLFIEIMTYLHLRLKADAAYGALANYALSEEETDAMYFDQTVSCFNIFNPVVVKKINRANLEQIDAYRKEYLKDGSLLLVLAENPMDVSEDKLKMLRGKLFG